MRSLFIGVSLLALMAPGVHAQPSNSSEPAAIAGQTAPGTYMVFFPFNRATLTADARRVIAEAADEYRRGGIARIALSGHADRAGSDDYNVRLSERRVAAVEGELIRLGVPASAIAAMAEGERNPLVPTADGVREARNRRVEISISAPPEPPPPAVAAPEPAPVEPMPLPRRAAPKRFTFTLGPLYGRNFGETDGNGGKTENDLVGAELAFTALPGFLGGLSFKQGVLWGINTVDDGLSGRSVVGLDFAPAIGVVRPFVSANVGGVYGKGVQDGFVAGPEVGLDLHITESLALRAKAAYDYQFRNSDWDEGIVWGGMNVGVAF